MRYIILIIFISLFCFNFVSARETSGTISDWAEGLEQKFITPVSRMFESMKQGSFGQDVEQKVEQKSQEMMGLVQDKAEEKGGELKQEIKQEIKERTRQWFQNKKEWVEDMLSPLKINIQERSDLIREWVNKLRKES